MTQVCVCRNHFDLAHKHINRCHLVPLNHRRHREVAQQKPQKSWADWEYVPPATIFQNLHKSDDGDGGHKNCLGTYEQNSMGWQWQRVGGPLAQWDQSNHAWRTRLTHVLPGRMW